MGKVISLLAIGGIVYLNRLAILHDIDGVALVVCTDTLALLAGMYIKTKKRRR